LPGREILAAGCLSLTPRRYVCMPVYRQQEGTCLVGLTDDSGVCVFDSESLRCHPDLLIDLHQIVVVEKHHSRSHIFSPSSLSVSASSHNIQQPNRSCLGNCLSRRSQNSDLKPAHPCGTGVFRRRAAQCFQWCQCG